jgi:cysteinyl-tRNA synthetase
MDPQKQNLVIFNTLTGEKESFVPLNGSKVSMYVCGPTVYDDAHLGHARCYITWDVLYRFLKFLDYDVKYVRNVTDVDDKILNRAKERNELPSALAKRNYDSFTADMQALNVLPPDEEPHATQYIAQMLEGIQTLIQNNAAYRTSDGSVYFRVSAKNDYGKLSKKPLDDLKAGARVEVDPNKESPLDFALWKAVPLEDSNGWESPWPAKGAKKGWGRPGWHMECSAMNHAVFGEQIDIHAGGADLIFPHHENEIAQSEAWTGKQPFANYWMHNGFVNVSGEKMSKSLGNFSTVKKVLERYDANTIRYFLLTNHYRMPVDFNDEALQSVENRITKIRRFFRAGLQKHNVALTDVQVLIATDYMDEDVIRAWHSFQDAMSNDLNTAKALATLDAAASSIENVSAARGKDFLKLFIRLADILGFNLPLLFENRASLQEDVGSIRERLSARKEAKAARNWAQADAIRNELTNNGLQLLDNKDGTTSVEKDGVEIVRV